MYFIYPHFACRSRQVFLYQRYNILKRLKNENIFKKLQKNPLLNK